MTLKNQKGLTLIEVLLSIVLLVIILTSVMQFFPQMGMFNKQNEDKQQAINLAKKELIIWQEEFESINIEGFLNTTQPTSGDLVDLPETLKSRLLHVYNLGNFHIIESKSEDGEFDVIIKLKTTSDIASQQNESISQSNVYLIMVELYKDKNKDSNPISESYGYVTY